MAKRPLPEAAELRKLFRYDPKTGMLYWRHRPADSFSNQSIAAGWNKRFAGKRAFIAKNKSGYYHGTIWGVRVSAHRVIVALTTGEWPDNYVDHINGDKTDNRIENLRSVTCQENLRNKVRSKANISGVTGVSRRGSTGRWRAQIQDNGTCVHLGYFGSFLEAVAARQRAAEKCGYHPNHDRPPVSS